MNAILEILQICFCIKDPYTDELTGDEKLVADLANLLDISEKDVVETAGDSYSRYFATYKPAQSDDSFWSRIFPHGRGEILTERTLTYTARAAIRQRLEDAQANPSNRDYLFTA